MAIYYVTTSFEMADGRELECVRILTVTPGYLSGPPEDCYPEESEFGEGSFRIDGDEVKYEDLPKGLSVIADKLENATYGEYNYCEAVVEPDYDYEPDYESWD